MVGIGKRLTDALGEGQSDLLVQSSGYECFSWLEVG
jgi:hypothetical protein